MKHSDLVRQRGTPYKWLVSTCKVNSDATAAELGYAYETAIFHGPDAEGDHEFIEVVERYRDETAALAGHFEWMRKIRESGYSSPPKSGG